MASGAIVTTRTMAAAVRSKASTAIPAPPMDMALLTADTLRTTGVFLELKTSRGAASPVPVVAADRPVPAAAAGRLPPIPLPAASFPPTRRPTAGLFGVVITMNKFTTETSAASQKLGTAGVSVWAGLPTRGGQPQVALGKVATGGATTTLLETMLFQIGIAIIDGSKRTGGRTRTT